MKSKEMNKAYAGVTIGVAVVPLIVLSMFVNIPFLIMKKGSILSMSMGYTIMIMGFVTALRMVEYYFLPRNNAYKKLRFLFGALIAVGSIVIGLMAARDTGPNNANKILAGVPALYPIIYSAALIITHGCSFSWRLSLAMPYICLAICIVLHLPFFFIGLAVPFFNTWFPFIFVAVLAILYVLFPLFDKMEQWKIEHTDPAELQAEREFDQNNALLEKFGKEFKKEVFSYCISHNRTYGLFFKDAYVGTHVELYETTGKISITVTYEVRSEIMGAGKKALSVLEDAVDHAIATLKAPIGYTVNYSVECVRYI